MAKPNPSSVRITMREIARLAGGVHPSTVSLALRNSPSISAALRKRIQAVATRAGYRRDPLLDAFNTRRLSSLVHRVQPVIAWVVEVESRAALLASPRHAAMWNGALAAAEALHHQVEPFFLSRAALTPPRLESILRARGIESVVFAGLRTGAPPLFAWERYSAVKIDCLGWSQPGYTITGDLRQATRVAMRQLREQGGQRIGLALNSSRGRIWNDLLLAGCLIEQRLGSDGTPIRLLATDECPGAPKLAEWVQGSRLDAVLADWPAMGAALRGVQTAALSPIPWACLDVTEAPPDVAGVVIPHERVGRLAIEQTVNLSRTNQRGSFASASTTLVPIAWRDSLSLRPNE